MPGARGLDQLKEQATAQGRWREGNDGSLEKGPFPQEKTAVNVLSQSVDSYTGAAILALSPRHAGTEPRVYYSTSASVCESDPMVEDLEAFRTGEPTLYFLAVDTSGAHAAGEPTRWVAKLKVRYQVHDRPDHREVELAVSPQAQIRYSSVGWGELANPNVCPDVRPTAVTGGVGVPPSPQPTQAARPSFRRRPESSETKMDPGLRRDDEGLGLDQD